MARFVAATHQPLEELIKKKQFREDLFYRLNVLPIWIPPLRDRPDDIEALSVEFCRKFGLANGRGALNITGEAVALLREQDWPGNIRQLQNFVERLVVLSDGDRLTGADVERELARQERLGRSETGSDAGTTLEASRREAEKDALVDALERSKNNRSMAARLLGISRRTLYHKLDDHGLA